MQVMDEALRCLLADYKLAHYQAALEGVGLRCIADLGLVKDEDLLSAGMQNIQRRAFARLREQVVGKRAEASVARRAEGGKASQLPHLLGQRQGFKHKEPELPPCIILDGRMVTPAHTGGWCEGRGPQQQGFLSVQQLRAAAEWFQDQVPACRVQILLCGATKEQWFEHPLLEDFRHCLVWKPSGTDNDRVLVESAARGLDGRRVQIVTNSRFQRMLGMTVCEKTINAAWVDENLVRFTFSGGAFQPALAQRRTAGFFPMKMRL
mmetsp:Transcript_4735/g.14846  ORF Transcript_4735/g.14846 Transcript_4735/m.14846 type:complete len:264 (+) Transcript_4735:102-893(+)